jgi:4-hydroxythreonine-4-phosphate dehydrogenase
MDTNLNTESKRIIGITLGDFNGIGPELILKILSNELILNYCTPVVYGIPFVFKHYADLLELSAPFFHIVKNDGGVKHGALNMRICTDEKVIITPGQPSEQAGRVAVGALNLAVEDIKNGLIHSLLTAPIDKETAVKGGLSHNGHTEFLATSFNSDSLMILMDDSLKVAMVTGHTSLQEVASFLSKEKILHKIKQASETLISDFNVVKPKIAVLGLNPHLGDGGLMGNEEKELILPAILEAQENEILVYGPYAPDGFFGGEAHRQFDLVLGMYHDQVLIPFKQNAFTSGINFTAGLPFVRTSPDHGVAYDIAGLGKSDVQSFINALYAINKIDRARKTYVEIHQKPLEFMEHKREKFSIGVPNLK